MGTIDIVSGAIEVVSYSKPRGVLSFCIAHLSTQPISNLEIPGLFPIKALTLGPVVAEITEPSASQPTISEMSCTSDLTSLELELPDRSWLSLASRHGCFETCTLGGRDAILFVAVKSKYSYSKISAEYKEEMPITSGQRYCISRLGDK